MSNQESKNFNSVNNCLRKRLFFSSIYRNNTSWTTETEYLNIFVMGDAVSDHVPGDDPNPEHDDQHNNRDLNSSLTYYVYPSKGESYVTTENDFVVYPILKLTPFEGFVNKLNFGNKS